YEVMGLRKDGSTNWIEFYGNRVVIAGEPTIIGSMLDITERKLAEELMLREKALSDTIINSLPGVFYLRKENGEYLRWNKNFEAVTGYTPEEIKKLSVKDLIVKEDQERVKEANEKAFKEGYAMVEIKAITKDGTKIPYLLSIAPLMYENQLCLLGTGIDISSRINAQEELRSSEQKYKLLFESNPVPLWMIAKDDMTIIAVNDTAANLYGYTKEELLNSSAKIMRPKEDLDKQKEGYNRDVSTSTDMGVVRHLKKDGTIMFIQIIAHDIIFEGRPVRLSLTNDITEKLKAEESLQKSEANLQAILKTTDTAYALLDMELKVLEFNQKATEFVKEQYHHDVKKGDRLVDYFPKDRLPQFAGFAKEVLAGKNISYEVDYPQADGSICWFFVRLFPIVNDNKEILGMMMALYDITERKNAEQDLKNAYGRIQRHINNIKDMAWKQSHLMRSPLANLKALSELLKDHPTDIETLDHFQTELNRMDAIIHEMAEQASGHEE
ncbi:MAG TPA: PAS domain S-box protein, partial [Mucilaginibacter sp.]|nr:PAS domain S-box protein [Mucilaginibacter sp.]